MFAKFRSLNRVELFTRVAIVSIIKLIIIYCSRTEIVYNLEKKGKKVVGAIREGKWKLIQKRYNNLLYNLDDDPEEKTNLASSRKDILKQLKFLLRKRAATIVPTIKVKAIKDGSDKDKDSFVRTGW